MNAFRRPCSVCGELAQPGATRCDKHATRPPSSCRVCPRRAVPGEGFCAFHLPTEADRPHYRHAYTKAQYQRNRARRYKLAEGRCEACGVTLSAPWQCDHLIPLADGGTNALENLRVLCASCHTEKTKRDRERRRQTWRKST